MLAWLVPHVTAAVSAHVLCTPYNHTPCHFMQSHIRKLHAYLAVTCHLHFWQTDWGLLCATVVTRGWKNTEIRVTWTSLNNSTKCQTMPIQRPSGQRHCKWCNRQKAYLSVHFTSTIKRQTTQIRHLNTSVSWV